MKLGENNKQRIITNHKKSTVSAFKLFLIKKSLNADTELKMPKSNDCFKYTIYVKQTEQIKKLKI